MFTDETCSGKDILIYFFMIKHRFNFFIQMREESGQYLEPGIVRAFYFVSTFSVGSE